MPSFPLVEAIRGRGIVGVLSGHRRPGIPPEQPYSPKPAAASGAPLSEVPLHVETELEKTANRIRTIFKETIPNLSHIPFGTHSGGVVWYDTRKRFDDQHGNAGGIIFAVDKNGELHMRKALAAQTTPNEAWDMETSQRYPASDQEIIDYTLPLMVVVQVRSNDVRTKSIHADREKGLPHDGPETRCLGTDAVNIELAKIELTNLAPAA